MGLIIGVLFSIGGILLWGAIREPNQFRWHKSKRYSGAFVKNTKLPSDVWPNVVDDLASAIRAGLSLPQAVIELTNTGPEQLRPVFQLCRDQYQATGDFNTGLSLIAENLKDPQADKFVSVLQIAREELVLRGEIVARQSWTVNGAKLAVAAPWITALVLSTRDAAANVYLSPSGMRMLAICALVSVLAYAAMLKIAQLPNEKRLLA